MTPSRFRALVEYVLDNLFDILTIAVAGVLVFRYQIRPATTNDIPDLATWILAVLGLLAVSGLWDRNRRLDRIEKLAEEGRDLVLRRVSGKARASDFFLAEPQLANSTFASAQTIFLSGYSLTRATREYLYILGQRLVAGAHIQIMLLDPDFLQVLEQASLRSMAATVDYWRGRVESTQTIIEAIAQTPGNKGKLEIGYLPYTPSFGFVMIDPDDPHGFCFVEIYHHKSVESNPTFELRAADDPYWHSFFRRQYDILWRSCRIEQLSKPPIS
jgi:hypothetical protein